MPCLELNEVAGNQPVISHKGTLTWMQSSLENKEVVKYSHLWQHCMWLYKQSHFRYKNDKVNHALGPLKILLLQLSLFWWLKNRLTSFWIFDLCHAMNDTAYQEYLIYCCVWLKFLVSLRLIKVTFWHSIITVLQGLSSKLPFVYYSSTFHVMLEIALKAIELDFN